MSGGPGALPAALFHAAGGTRLLRSLGDRWALAGDGTATGPGGPRLRRREAPPFLVLIYHRVHPAPGAFAIDAIAPDRFERQMHHVARAYRPMALEELVRSSRDGTVPSRAIAVTFDDGYADNYEHALPILRRHAIPATVFLVTGCVGTGAVPWHDQVLLAFARTRRPSVRLPGAEAEAAAALETEEARRDAAFRTLARLKPMPEEERIRAVAAIREELGVVDGREEQESLMLDWERVRAMRGQGIRFGAHTETHPILSRLTPERARQEIERPKRAIEGALGEECAFFAYPNGRPEDFSAENVAQVRSAGYRAALTTSFGVNEAGADPYRLRRGTPWEADPARFALKLAYYRLRAAGGD